MTDLPTGYERRYVSHAARVAHAVDVDREWIAACCGRRPVWYSAEGWLGTGSQAEYERATALPLCKACARLLAPP